MIIPLGSIIKAIEESCDKPLCKNLQEDPGIKDQRSSGEDLRKQQYGFRLGRLTINLIFKERQLQGRCYKYEKDVILALMDKEKHLIMYIQTENIKEQKST